MISVAALYVDARGPYAGRPGVDPWPESRDARCYPGRAPVVAHPPCASWGAYSKPSPTSRARGPLRGDDGGTFAAALAAVTTWGGVLEHPAGSHAWTTFWLPRPPAAGGWVASDHSPLVWSCQVDQGHYGHAARKPTWLLYCGTAPPPPLPWGPSSPPSRPPSPGRTRGVVERMSRRQRALTPPAFADVLISLARHAVTPLE